MYSVLPVATSSVAASIAFKVELRRPGRGPVFHRFRLSTACVNHHGSACDQSSTKSSSNSSSSSTSFTYSELSSVVSNLWGERPKTLVLEYQDDEGDCVRVTTEVEWAECQRLHLAGTSPVLRLVGRRAKDIKKKDGEKKKESTNARALSEKSDSSSASSSESEAEVDDGLENERMATIKDFTQGGGCSHLRTQQEVKLEMKRQIQKQPPQQEAPTSLASSSSSSHSSSRQAMALDPCSAAAADFFELALRTNSSLTSTPREAALSPRATSSFCFLDDARPPSSVTPEQRMPRTKIIGTEAEPEEEEEEDSATTLERPVSQEERHSSDGVLDLMSLTYSCNAAVELFAGATNQFGATVKRLVNPNAPSEVHLDIDRAQLSRDVVAKAQHLRGAAGTSASASGQQQVKEHLAKAEHLLRTALAVFQDPANTEDVRLLQYQLACVLSEQGQLEEALDMLMVAKANGHPLACLLENGEGRGRQADGLAKVSKHPRVCEVLPEPEVEEEENDDKQADEEAFYYYEEEEEEAEAAPGQSSTPQTQDPKVVTLLSMFPAMTLIEASHKLSWAQGNIHRVVDQMFHASGPTAQLGLSSDYSSTLHVPSYTHAAPTTYFNTKVAAAPTIFGQRHTASHPKVEASRSTTDMTYTAKWCPVSDTPPNATKLPQSNKGKKIRYNNKKK